MNHRFSQESEDGDIATTNSAATLNSNQGLEGSLKSQNKNIFKQNPPYSNPPSYSSISVIREDVLCDKMPVLQKTLMEFTLAFLTEQPIDIIDYAVLHFTKLQKARIPKPSLNESNMEYQTIDFNDAVCSNTKRRLSVQSEVIDPEGDYPPLVVIPKTQEQQSRLRKAIRNIFVFRYLDDELIAQVLDAMFEKRVDRGENVIVQGDDGDFFYVIERGNFVCIKDGNKIFSWNDSGAFGEIALMYQIKRTATVQATTDGLLWALDRLSFRRILVRHSYVKQKTYVKFLEDMPLLKNLNPWERLTLAEFLQPLSFNAGDMIIKMGDDADGMYFIEEGEVHVFVEKGKKGSVLVNKLGPSQYFGELALLMNDKRHANVIAYTDVKLAFLGKESFERLLGKCIDYFNRAVEDYNLKSSEIKSYLSLVRLNSRSETFINLE